jgi:DNA-binding SARP family transcriptional activator/serine/threonine protein kinase/WD40 repeat protein
MQLGVLGPLEVVEDGARVPLGGPKQRTVLALLVQGAGGRVSVDELILAVYGEDAPGGARHTVQTYVSNLRQVFREVLRGTGDGYVLDVEPTVTDVGRFESAYEAAVRELANEPERAALRLVEGLALWRGHPYAGVEHHGVLDAEIARLQELRLAALERRIECDLALGRHRELVTELESLAAEHPFRESLRAHQSLALYRCGRQSEALATLERTRRVLGDELGIDPSPQLQLLERQILVQDPALELEVGLKVERRALLVAELDAEHWSVERRATALARRDEVLAEVLDDPASSVDLRGTAVFVSVGDVSVAARTAVRLAGLGTEPTLRVAVDHGDVEVADEVVTGPPVNRAARIVALAHPGQVLLSPDAHQALTAAGTPGWGATALGRHVVTGIDEPLALHQLQGEGLMARFPPLRAGRLPPPVPTSRPASVPGYELRERLGTGETSVLYRAYQASVGREVVVRTIRHDHAADPAFIRSFEAEGQRVARLAHPHLLPLVDYWRAPDGAFLVHPLVGGGDLRRWAARAGLDGQAALDTIEQVGETLTYAHAHGVFHGRLHPGNVLLDEAGNLYLADVGVAQMCAGLLGSSASAYAAPEAVGGGSPTVAADVYALGVLSFELLEGRRPPPDEPLPLPATAVGDVLARATSSDPAERYEQVGDLLGELRSAVTGAAGPPPPRSAARNPYRGLEPFLEADAGDFHGREELVGDLVRVLAERRLVTVVGPSGIGKSSLVRAGLVPAVRGGAIEGSHRWLITDLFPGARPFDELAAALRRIAVDATADLSGALRSSEFGLHRCAQQLLPGESELLLLIDQFEELFTQTVGEDTRRAFLTLLIAAVTEADPRVRIVVTLRADFFDRPLRDASFAEVMRHGVVAVRAPSREELARAVRRPAEGVGVQVEDRLVDRIVGDADGEPGALPLIQYVLAERFATRDADVLSLAAYDASGGLHGAIGRKAEELYLGLTPSQRDATRHVFLRLVTVDEDDEDTRRRVRRDELARLGLDSADLHQVLESFGRARLLSFDRDPITRGPTIEVAHEAILTQWDRLRGWIDAVRDDLLTARRLTASSREWEDASHDPSFLLRGARLEATERWREHSGLHVTDDEAAYLHASRQAADVEAATSRRRSRRTFTALAAALTVTLAFSAMAVAQRAGAEDQARLTRARELAGDALFAVDADPERGILLAIEALDTYRDPEQRPIPEAVAALQTALQASRVTLHLRGGPLALAVSPDGRWLATDSPEDPSLVTVVELGTGQEVSRLQGRLLDPATDSRAMIGEGGIAFSPDGTLLAVSYRGAEGAPAIETFDTATWRPEATYPGPAGEYYKVQFAGDDGEHLLALVDPAAGGEVVTWDVATGERTATVSPAAWFDVVPGTAEIALTAAGAEEVRFVDVRDGVTVQTLGTPGIVGELVAVNPDGTRVALNAFQDRVVEVWDRAERTQLTQLANTSPLDVRWSPDGRLVHTSNDGSIRLVSVDGEREELVLRGHSDGVTSTAFTPDGETLASISWAGELRTWDLTLSGPAELGNLAVPDGRVNALVPAPAGDGLAASVHLPGEQARIDLADLRDATVSTLVDGLRSPAYHWPVIAGDHSAAAGLDEDLRGHVYDLPSGESRLELPPCQSPKAFSYDGSRLVVEGNLLCAHERYRELPEPPPGAVLRNSVVDALSGEVLYDLGERPLNWAALGPPGTPSERYVALLVDWQTVELHDHRAGRLVGQLDIEPALSTTIWFSDDGRHIAFGTQSGEVTVLDVEAAASGVPLEDATAWRFQEPAGGVVVTTSIAGGRLATSSMTGHVRVYDLADRRLLADLTIEPLGPPWVVFNADATAAHYTDGRTIRRFELDTDRLEGLARSRLTRDRLTDDECQQYRIDRVPCPPAIASAHSG